MFSFSAINIGVRLNWTENKKYREGDDPSCFHGLNGIYHKLWVPVNIETLLSKTLYTYLALSCSVEGLCMWCASVYTLITNPKQNTIPVITCKFIDSVNRKSNTFCNRKSNTVQWFFFYLWIQISSFDIIYQRSEN